MGKVAKHKSFDLPMKLGLLTGLTQVMTLSCPQSKSCFKLQYSQDKNCMVNFERIFHLKLFKKSYLLKRSPFSFLIFTISFFFHSFLFYLALSLS